MNAIQKNEEKSVEAVGRAAKTVGKLRLDKERIRTLAGNELATVAGAAGSSISFATRSWSVP